MRTLKSVVVGAVVVAIAAGFYIYAGLYPMGADVPHNKLTYWLLETIRERSVLAASRDIEVPSLDDPEMLLMGGPDYNDMCVSCHLKPGLAQSDMSIGLYPAPPNLAAAADDVETEQSDEQLEAAARRQYWIIKHGIKASGMPAWGPTHDDQRIWAMVAFLQKLPALSPEAYQILTARGESDGGHGH